MLHVSLLQMLCNTAMQRYVIMLHKMYITRLHNVTSATVM